MKDLIVKVEGKVLSNNITEFESDALAILSGMSTDLITDDDFSKAEDDIKLCKEIEIRLDNVKQDIIHQSADVSEVVTKISQLFSKFRETRLTQEKLVKKEKLSRKNEIIQQAIKEVNDAVSGSPVAFAFTVDEQAIYDATKRKSSLGKMVDAIGDVVVDEAERLAILELLFEKNMEKIEETEKVFPGLFPDKKTVSLTPVETVEATIEARINKFKLDQQEKIRREEEERARAARMQEAKKQQEEAEKEKASSDTKTSTPAPEQEIQPKKEAQRQEIPADTTDQKETNDYALVVEIRGTRDDAVRIAQEVNNLLAGGSCIMQISLNEKEMA